MSRITGVPTAAQGLAGRTRPGALAATLKRWWVAYIVWRIEQAGIAELAQMSARKLEDIGLTRTQVEPAVRVDRQRDHMLSRSS
jgi:uncharacterized protein YjiS (DUF1127 family)